MWDIIIWANEDAIDFVPSCWSSNDDKTSYKYPIHASQQKIRQIVYECKNVDVDYKVCAARCIKSGVTNLKKAQDYCKRGQYTSNIDSEEGTSLKTCSRVQGKRAIKKSKMLLNYIDEQENTNEETDQTDETSSEDENAQIRKKRFTVPYSDTKQTHNDVRSVCSSPILASNSSIPTPAIVSRNSPIPITPGIASRNSQISRSSPNLLTSGSGVKDFQLTVIKELADLKYITRSIEKKLEKLETHRQTTDATLNTTSIPPKEKFEALLSVIPCESQEQINQLEQLVKEPENKNYLVNVLFLVGGNTLQKTVNFAMSKVLGKEISLQYSGQGKKKKLPFCKLTLYSLIIEAVRKRHEQSTEEEIKKAISLYLATSKSRLPPSERKSNADNQTEDN